MLPTIPADKALHLIYGAAAWLAVAAGASAVGLPSPGLIGLAAAVLLGVAKEAWDWWRVKRKGEARGVEWADAVATAAGGLVVFLANKVPA